MQMSPATLCMINKCFFYNTKWVQILIQYFPAIERKILQAWVDKLVNMNKSLDEMMIRNNYMWFLLIMLKTRKARTPFNKLPPQKLGIFSEIIIPEVYQDMLIPKYIEINDYAASNRRSLPEKYTRKSLTKFLEKQDNKNEANRYSYPTSVKDSKKMGF